MCINGYALGSGWEWYSLDFSSFIEDYIAVSEITETMSKREQHLQINQSNSKNKL